VDAFETERLVVREVAEDTLAALLPVYAGNAAYLALTSGFAGEPGSYDLESLQRDFALARITPGRHIAGIYEAEAAPPVGVLDWLEENPTDGRAWIGLVMIRPDRQRRRLGSEALDGLLERLGGAVRMGVIRRNEACAAFARSLGFEPVSTVGKRMNAPEEIVVYERLSAAAAK
jgi:RimJ/RimL family protein N-acetyltransferase